MGFAMYVLLVNYLLFVFGSDARYLLINLKGTIGNPNPNQHTIRNTKKGIPDIPNFLFLSEIILEVIYV